MKFIDLCKLLFEKQDVHLIYGDFAIFGTIASIEALVAHEVNECRVINLEADNDTLKVWLEKE